MSRPPFLKFVFCLSLLWVTMGWAAEAPLTTTPTPAISSEKKKWVEFLPYAPEKNEYKLEFGGMWEADNLYWLGGTYGRHLGTCWGVSSNVCQQYLDFTGGAGSRQGYTDGLALASLRWQYVSFPKPYSPSFGLFSGVMNIRDDDRDRRIGVYGLSFGLTTTLHQKLDLKWENRIGSGDHFWSQSVVSISLKIDRWVDAFAEGMKNVGKKTIEAPKTLMEFLK